MKKRLLSIFLILTVFGSLFCAGMPAAQAAGTEAARLTPTLEYAGFRNTVRATDGDNGTYAAGETGATVRITAAEEIGLVYLCYQKAPGTWIASSAAARTEQGKDAFLHETVDVAAGHGNVKEITLQFPAGVELASLTVYGKGELPADVQAWQPPCEQADLMLLSAHSDDEQLFFAGIIPYYAQVRGARVQVVFFTEHPADSTRWHERLDSLWASGCRNYPVVSPFPAAVSYNKADAYKAFATAGFTEAKIVDWLALQVRTFRPFAVVTHSLTGERDEGQHMAAADAMTKAAARAADASFVTEGKAAYDLPKLYLRAYAQNPIVLNQMDTPSDKLGGKTPFLVSQTAYLAYSSRVSAATAAASTANRRFYGTAQPLAHPEQITVTKASQITTDALLSFGLYRKGEGVADDVLKNDFLENMTVPPAETTEIAAQPQPPETSVPPADTSVPTGTPTGTGTPATAAPTSPSGSTAGQTVPDAPGRDDSGNFPPLSYEKTHSFLWIGISAALGLAALGFVLCYGIRKIRHCNNR